LSFPSFPANQIATCIWHTFVASFTFAALSSVRSFLRNQHFVSALIMANQVQQIILTIQSLNFHNRSHHISIKGAHNEDWDFLDVYVPNFHFQIWLIFFGIIAVSILDESLTQLTKMYHHDPLFALGTLQALAVCLLLSCSLLCPAHCPPPEKRVNQTRERKRNNA
jgi:hypothetical protein